MRGIITFSNFARTVNKYDSTMQNAKLANVISQVIQRSDAILLITDLKLSNYSITNVLDFGSLGIQYLLILSACIYM